MPNIKPLRKLVTRAREVREHHRERHTPSGFAFALADSIDYLDQGHWDKVTSHDSLFLSRRYLRVLEEAGPENLRQCYTLIFQEKEAVAAVAAQSVTVSVARLRRKASTNGRLDGFDEKVLVCGNLLSWGMHRFACLVLSSLLISLLPGSKQLASNQRACFRPSPFRRSRIPHVS